ncbi:MAG: dephospho-CoA kinase [Xanthobacteraceae bacterium]|nr:dephospho-CoA kinase [Xanthobacteraceae bacterium]MBX3549526.1 dephospho-CoA kinase [Xanthobacteraceae bacterium]
MIVLGLTGSVGMGKSTTAQMFVEEGVPMFDADAAVHQLYAGEAVPLIEREFPGTTRNGTVDREKLSAHVVGKPQALSKLEKLIHPLVGKLRAQFMADAEKSGAKAVLLDIPLLFETGDPGKFHAVIVVSAPHDIQRARVLARPGMTPEKFEAILKRQLPDSEKRARADFVIDTGQGLEFARKQVKEVLAEVFSPGWTRKK